MLCNTEMKLRAADQSKIRCFSQFRIMVYVFVNDHTEYKEPFVLSTTAIIILSIYAVRRVKDTECRAF